MEARKKILCKLEQMNTYLNELDEILPDTKNKYLQNLIVRRACEKTIESAIEAVISIISMIVSSKNLGLPQSEDDLVNILEKKKILTKITAEKIREMKGFRNILVHKYGEINDKQVYEFLTSEMSDFSKFEKEIKTFLGKGNQ